MRSLRESDIGFMIYDRTDTLFLKKRRMRVSINALYIKLKFCERFRTLYKYISSGTMKEKTELKTHSRLPAMIHANDGKMYFHKTTAGQT